MEDNIIESIEVMENSRVELRNTISRLNDELINENANKAKLHNEIIKLTKEYDNFLSSCSNIKKIYTLLIVIVTTLLSIFTPYVGISIVAGILSYLFGLCCVYKIGKYELKEMSEQITLKKEMISDNSFLDNLYKTREYYVLKLEETKNQLDELYSLLDDNTKEESKVNENIEELKDIKKLELK